MDIPFPIVLLASCLCGVGIYAIYDLVRSLAHKPTFPVDHDWTASDWYELGVGNEVDDATIQERFPHAVWSATFDRFENSDYCAFHIKSVEYLAENGLKHGGDYELVSRCRRMEMPTRREQANGVRFADPSKAMLFKLARGGR